MQNVRWVNQFHPQTLRIGVILLYFNAVSTLLGSPFGGAISLLIILGSVAGGVGTANDRRPGYYLAVLVAAIIPALLVYVLWIDGLDLLFNIRFLLSAVFPVALLAALVHPLSRNYVKIYFE
ncbi:MAG: hypothetical protein AAF567_15440 [Actinomycetota bacterium]